MSPGCSVKTADKNFLRAAQLVFVGFLISHWHPALSIPLLKSLLGQKERGEQNEEGGTAKCQQHIEDVSEWLSYDRPVTYAM